jgi:hypothetical protein
MVGIFVVTSTFETWNIVKFQHWMEQTMSKYKLQIINLVLDPLNQSFGIHNHSQGSIAMLGA